MLNQVLCRGSTVRVFDETLRHEILEVLGEVTLQLRRSILRDIEECLHRVQVGMWRLSICHFHSCDAQRPDISFKVVPSLLNDFGCHPERGTDECVALRLDVRELGGHSKVGQLDLARL